MPPKKVNEVRSDSPVAGGEEGAGKESAKDLVSIEDHTLPKSIVTRLAKGVLPPNTQIQGNATIAITKGATVFVNYLASQANEICLREGRKTINPADVLRAIDDLEFPDFKPRLEAELAKFNEIQSEKRSAARAKKSSERTTTTTDPSTGEQIRQPAGQTSTENVNGEPAAKRARMDVDDGGDADLDVEDSYIPDNLEKGEDEEVEDEVEEDEDDEEDTLEVDGDDVEEPEESKEDEDEALDNGDVSD